MARRPTSRPAPQGAALKQTLGALLAAAAAGRADLGWMDQAVRKAGYLPAAEALSRREARATVRLITQALADAETTAESPCCKACLRHAVDALSTLVARE
jgi:hypothetical protein